MRWPWLAALAVVLLSPGVLLGQVLSGRIFEQDSANPIGGALVQLLGPDSVGVASVLSGQGGRYVVRLSGSGPYRLRIQRIGYATVLTQQLDAVRAAEAPFDVTLAIEAIQLDPIVATGSGRCVVDPRTGVDTAVLWDQARKVLEVTALIQREQLLQFEVVRFRRELSPDRAVLKDETLQASELRRPFYSLPVDSLTRYGFVQAIGGESRYFMPDLEVALSDAFLDHHCFHIAVQEGPQGRLVGLAFEPLGSDGPPDVAGVLWLDGRTGELQYMEYTYTGLVGPADGAAGGRAEFEQLGTGAWAVRRWHIAMPIIGERSRFLGLSREHYLIGLREEGGEIREAYDASGSPVTRPGTYTLEGRAFDLDEGRPLAGASIYLSGTGRVHVADEEGNFVFRDLSPGEYLVTLAHPLLDTMVVFPPIVRVRLRIRSEPLLLLSPSREETLAEVCPDVSADAQTGVLSGQVVDEEDRPLADIEVRMRLMAGRRSSEARATTDERGHYRFCGVPPGGPLSVSAADDDGRSEETIVTVRARRFSRVDLTVRGWGFQGH